MWFNTGFIFQAAGPRLRLAETMIANNCTYSGENQLVSNNTFSESTFAARAKNTDDLMIL